MKDCECGCKERIEELEKEVSRLERSKNRLMSMYQFFKKQNESEYKTFQDKLIDDELKESIDTRSLVMLEKVEDSEQGRKFVYTTAGIAKSDRIRFADDVSDLEIFDVETKMNRVILYYND